jgi:hypothetical protein
LPALAVYNWASQLQAAGPSKFKRVAEFMVNTVVAGLTGALRKAQASLAAANRKAEAAAKEAQEVLVDGGLQELQ